jgi:superfamily II DNA or RNA helicase
MMAPAAELQIPEVGQAVRVRNRLATVRAVEPYDSRDAQGRLHIVDVEYLDDCRFPEAEQLLWEVEATASVLGKTSLPGVDAHRPDSPTALQAFVNAHRWTRLNRLREKDGIEDEPLLGVWNSAIQVHPYQLEPVLRALAMPRVSLLLADGVGLGKTIQSGLVLEELLLRRRIRRILVLCPAMLQRQWRYELRRKFNLEFEVIDSDTTFQLRRRMGIDTNPWKAFPRIITSMDYLRMPDVLGQFLQASGAGPDAEANGSRTLPHAPWDLLIVDECHHFAPQSGSRASQRTRMLREIRFLFEHRVFASATPHNGKTVCFTGLLELLDPIRFQMAVEMDEQDKENLAEVRIRRLKEDINKQSLRPPFAEQMDPVALPIQLSPHETALYAALREYRKHGHARLGQASAAERWLGQFIYSLLTKRLLSCPFAFARTWWRHLEDQPHDDQADLFSMARLTAERAEEQTRSDDEKATLEEDAARYSGAYFRSRGESVEDIQRQVGLVLDRLGYDRKTVEDPGKVAALARKSDSKTEALVRWVKDNLFAGGKLRDDERLIVFTEYKETLFYLEQRFLHEGFDKNTLRLLYGGMSADEFEAVKGEFEDATAAVRLLLATDAASEGINMQGECRWVIHYDVPWSPSRLVQRNGRVSRYGQDRDVSIYYFRCDQEEDMNFLSYVAGKVCQVQNDLGSVERVFDAAIQRHFQGKPTDTMQLSLLVDQEIARSPERVELGHAAPKDILDLTTRAKELLESTDTRLGISSQSLVEILRAAIAVEARGRWKTSPASRGSTASSRRPGGRAWPGRRSRWGHAPTAWNWCSTRRSWRRKSLADVCCGSRSIRCCCGWATRSCGRRWPRSAANCTHPIPVTASSAGPWRLCKGPGSRRSWSFTTPSPPSTNCGNRSTTKFFPRSSASRATGWLVWRTPFSRPCWAASSTRSSRASARRSGSAPSGASGSSTAANWKASSGHRESRCTRCSRGGPTPRSKGRAPPPRRATATGSGNWRTAAGSRS